MTTIVCVGNRFVDGDSAALRVHDQLRTIGVPSGLRLVDGGLAGLDLLLVAEQSDCLLFVDSMVGGGAPGEAVELEVDDIAAQATGRHDHAAGLPFLIRTIQSGVLTRIPDMHVIGIEGDSISSDQIQNLAAYVLRVAAQVTLS